MMIVVNVSFVWSPGDSTVFIWSHFKTKFSRKRNNLQVISYFRPKKASLSWAGLVNGACRAYMPRHAYISVSNIFSLHRSMESVSIFSQKPLIFLYYKRCKVHDGWEKSSNYKLYNKQFCATIYT